MRFALLLALVAAAACSGTDAASKFDSHATDLRTPAGSDMQGAVQRLTDRSGKNTVVTTRPDGIRVYQINQGMGEVVVARQNSDGSVTTKCVSTDKDGMVQGQSGAEK